MTRRISSAVMTAVLVGGALVVVAPAGPADAAPTNMTEVFGDEFSGSTLDTSKWDNRFPDASSDLWIYNAGDRYAFDPANVSVHDGYLWIKNEKRSSTYRGKTVSYTSGVISTNNKFTPQYGYAEIRMRHAAGSVPSAANSTQATYHDLWLAPSNPTNVTAYRGVDPWGWGSEVDVNEYHFGMGNNYAVNTHWGEFGALHQSTGLQSIAGSGPNAWHTYGLDWAPTELKFYLDGNLVKTITGASVPTGPEFLTLQGGIVGWGPTPNDALLPDYIQVDYIKYFQTPAQSASAAFSYPAPNLLANYSFEDGWQGNPGTATPEGWASTGTASAAKTANGSVVQGGLYLSQTANTSFDVTTAQTLDSVANGTYDLSAWVKSSGGQSVAALSVSDYGGSDRLIPISAASVWTRVTIDDVQVTNGQATISVRSAGSTGKWLAIDNVVFHDSDTQGSALPSGTYTLTNLNSGKRLTVADSTANGAVVDQQTASSSARQRWVLTSLGGGEFRIQNNATGKVLEVYNNSTANGGVVDQWTWNGGANQRWALQIAADGTYIVSNVGSGKVLDVYNNSTADGGTVNQWQQNGAANQRWVIRP